MRLSFVVGLTTAAALIAACGDSTTQQEAAMVDSGGAAMAKDDAASSGLHDASTEVQAVVDAGADRATDSGGDEVAEAEAGLPPVTHPRRFILADEPLRKVLLVDLDHPENDWDTPITGGARDLQLIGNNRVLVGTLEGPGGYHEVDITSGQIVKEVVGFGGVNAARRLKNGNTLLTGGGLDGSDGTVIIEVDANKAIKNKYVYPNTSDFRLMRPTASGNFLFGTAESSTPGNDSMVEFTPGGQRAWSVPVNNQPAYMALRLPNGDTAVTNGHGASLLIFDQASHLKQTIGGPNQPDANLVSPVHYSMFQILRNNHYVITNWQGHDTNLGSHGRQLIEYDADGKLVWWWQQDATRISGVHGVIVLDGLDTQKMYDDTNGILAPVE